MAENTARGINSDENAGEGGVFPRNTPPAAGNTPAPTGIFPFDAALPPALPMGGYLAARPFEATAERWIAQVHAELPPGVENDFAISAQALGMRPEDGALTRGKGGLAYTPHGFGQLLSLMLDSKPANLSAVLRWIRPERRAPVYVEDVRARTSRKVDDLMVLRTFLTPRPGKGPAGLVRAVRAVVSLRHSGEALDDLALCEALRAELPFGALAAVNRGIDKTCGYAEVETVGRHLVRTLHWENSETGSASMSFAAGARIRIVDALVIVGTTQNEVTAIVAADQSRQRMRHTAPGGKAERAKQALIASDRMRTKIRNVLVKGEAISDAWVRALEDFGPINVAELNVEDVAVAWEVLADAIEERTGFEGDDRKEFLAVLTDEKRLEGGAELPRGSAAHIAAVFAVMGRRAETMDAGKRLQEIAGKWLMDGWK